MSEGNEIKGNGSGVNKPARRQNQPASKRNDIGTSEINVYTGEEIDLFSFPDIRDYWDIILRRKWLIITCVLAFLASAFLYTLMSTPQYRATAVIEISPSSHRLTSFKTETEFDINSPDVNPHTIHTFYETQYRLLKSRSLAGNVVDRLGYNNPGTVSAPVDTSSEKSGLFNAAQSSFAKFAAFLGINSGKNNAAASNNPSPALNEQKTSKDSAIRSFIRGIEVSPDKRSRIAEINFTSTDPKFSAKAVNTLIDEYMVWVIQRRQESTRAARVFLENQLKTIKAKLEGSEENLARYAKKVDVVSMDKDLNLIYKQLGQLNESYAEAEAERIAKEALYSEVQKGNYHNLPQVVNDEGLQMLKNSYAQLKSEYGKLSAVYGPNYPEMKQMKAQMEALESDINQKRQSIAASIKRDYEAAVSKEQMFSQRQIEQASRTSDLNEKAIQYNILKREVDTNKSIYESLLNRYKETEIASAIETSPVNIVDYATVPSAPYKPSWAFNITIALMLGFMSGGVMAFVSEQFDNAIKDEDEIKNRYPVTYLGAIPYFGNDNGHILEKIVHTNPLSIVAEAYRVIRTSLLFSSPHNNLKSILISSSQPLEGKSTTASNLAIALSRFNDRVVIVDADMRRPRMQDLYLKSRNLPGLSSYLIDKSGLEEIIYSTDIEGLDVIPAGILPPNPADLLGSGRMNELIDRLSQMYDRVILDAPPLVAFADARLLSNYVDGVILVTSVGITQRNILRDTLNDLRQINANITGVIVNRMAAEKNKYSYYYHYYADESGHELKKNHKINPPAA